MRERRGQAARTEAYRLTGNFIGALFIHDTSRDLDPQLHAHIVLANATWDHEREEWLALQPAEMLRASGYLRQVFYRELSGRLHGPRALGHESLQLRRAALQHGCPATLAILATPARTSYPRAFSYTVPRSFRLSATTTF